MTLGVADNQGDLVGAENPIWTLTRASVSESGPGPTPGTTES
jgi:hypothetical protein